MSPNPDPSDPDESIDNYPVFERRPVLKALGAGTALSLGSGVATADGDDDEEDAGVETDETDDGTDGTDDGTDGTDDDSDGTEVEEVDSRQIHTAFGLPLAEGESIPDDVVPAQVVELDVEEEENVHENFPLEPDPEDPEQFVEVPAEFIFDPVGLHLDPGDVVHFDNLAGLHTVTAFHEKFGEEMFPMPTRIPEDATGFTSPPFVAGESWLYEFTEEGVYDILCLPHLGLGMVLRVVVGDVETTAEELAEFTEAVPPNAQTVLSAPELDPQSIVENETVGWGDLTLEQATPAAPTGEDDGASGEDDGTSGEEEDGTSPDEEDGVSGEEEVGVGSDEEEESPGDEEVGVGSDEEEETQPGEEDGSPGNEDDRRRRRALDDIF